MIKHHTCTMMFGPKNIPLENLPRVQQMLEALDSPFRAKYRQVLRNETVFEVGRRQSKLSAQGIGGHEPTSK